MVNFLPDNIVFSMIELLQKDGKVNDDMSILDMHLYLHDLFRTNLRLFDFYRTRAELLSKL